ncbi:GNAT family N-acetyltransferase [Halobacillus naozhouensis]|uniref:GNAT family N-acetyltransferase n=2 Tax=Halobacillus naozhouensis TaxID=554880 RepID=A0ABY8J058_9BACI|nr:GNAT family N-acetyltransferase [Halobacillus naozhouensis]WFT75884.1 GNAT family N-acetyltransferase [Halobacillus naozhouensis]
MVISRGVFQCDQLDGYAVLNEKEDIIGLITYMIEDECEIISLDSLTENKGVGTLLVQKVEQTAREKGIQHIRLVTTNDNIHAMRFYQKKGYRLSGIYHDAVEKARKLKPEIPYVSDNGIPITDEILFVKTF